MAICEVVLGKPQKEFDVHEYLDFYLIFVGHLCSQLAAAVAICSGGHFRP